jgi:hypothetical protein
MPISCAALVVVGVLVAAPAAANWHYTKWGMTPAQVVAASHGTAIETTPERRELHSTTTSGEVALLEAPWQSGRFHFTAFFLFDKGRLTRVMLDLKSGDPEDGAALLGSLRQKYGAAYLSRPDALGAFEVWHFHGDLIGYTATAGAFGVQYSALANADNRAL